MKKSLLLSFVLIFFVFAISYMEAGIVDSGHNILRQTALQNISSDEGKAGVCSFCHIPHSATGNTMWTGYYGAANINIGEVGRICGKCHNKLAGYCAAPIMADSIYGDGTSHNNHPLLDDNSDIYYDTGSGRTVSNSGPNYGGTKQWMSKWSGTDTSHLITPGDPQRRTAIECSSCHNVHATTKGVKFDAYKYFGGVGASGEFLRAKAFDITGTLGDTTANNDITGDGRKQIFCEYCHIGRSTSAWGPWNIVEVDGKEFSTHPVGRGDVDRITHLPTGAFNDTTVRKINDNDTTGWISSISIPTALRTGSDVANFADTTGYGGHLGGGDLVGILAGYDTAGIGYDTSEKGIVICQSCHKVHSSDTTSVGQDHDGVPINGNMFEEKKPDLLVINNSSKSGYNRLCEACHSYRPFLKIKANDPNTGDADLYNGHPLKHNKFFEGSYKYDINGVRTTDWEAYSSDLCATGPSIDIPLKWPTGGKNQPVCLSCHDVHGAQAKTKLLRRSTRGNDLICDDCHQRALGKIGLTHPLGESLVNTDGASWPDQANLTIFSPPVYNKDGGMRPGTRLPLYNDLAYTGENYSNVKYNTARVKISCDTCHDWANGIIHYYAGRRRDVNRETGPADDTTHVHKAYEDPNHNSELCVSCHTGDAFSPNRDTRNYDYGKDADQGSLRKLPFMTTKDGPESTNINYEGANPSAWIREYPTGVNSYEVNRTSRMGTHASGLRIEWNALVTPDDTTDSHYEYVFDGSWGDTSSCNNRKLSGVGKKLVSKWGQRYDTLLKIKNDAAIICQSCHTPHWAQEGLVEYNSAALRKEPTPNSAILYANQAESFMCRNCHFPVRTHSVSDVSDAKYRGRWETTGRFYKVGVVIETDNSVNSIHPVYTTVEQERKYLGSENYHLRDTTFFDSYGGGLKWRVGVSSVAGKNGGPMPPANYPKAGGSLLNPNTLAFPGSSVDTSTTGSARNLLVCDSCHAPHAANTSMGTFIMEAIFDSADNQTWLAPNGEKYNGGAEPSNPDDAHTCSLCHPQ